MSTCFICGCSSPVLGELVDLDHEMGEAVHVDCMSAPFAWTGPHYHVISQGEQQTSAPLGLVLALQIAIKFASAEGRSAALLTPAHHLNKLAVLFSTSTTDTYVQRCER
jgi:hypothetical protein